MQPDLHHKDNPDGVVDSLKPSQDRFSVAGRSLLVLAAFVVVVAGMRTAEPILTPFLLAIFIATLAGPPMFALQRRGIPGAAAMAMVLTGLVIGGLLLMVLLGSSVTDFVDRLPDYQQRLREYLDGISNLLAGMGVQVSRELLVQYMDPGKVMGVFASTLTGLGGALTNGVLIFFTVVFLLMEASGFPVKLKQALTDPDSSYPHFVHFADSLQNYLIIKAWISAVTALMVAVPLALLGLDYPLLWGVLMFLLNYIPNIGPIIAAVPAVLLALVQLGPVQAAMVAAIYLAANTLMGNIIEPRYMGRGVGISPLVVFLSLVFWGWVLGPVGMLLSVPLTMAVKIAMDSADETRWLAVLLGPNEKKLKSPPADTSKDPSATGGH